MDENIIESEEIIKEDVAEDIYLNIKKIIARYPK